MDKFDYPNQPQLMLGRRPVLLLAILFVVSSVAIFAHLQNLNIQLIESTTKQQVSDIFIQVVVLVSLLLLSSLAIVTFMINNLRQANQSSMKLNTQLSQEINERKAAQIMANNAKD